MTFGGKPECEGLPAGAREGVCPACGAELDAGVTPPDSIVVCSRCCATLLWDGTFSIATAEQIEGLPIRDRARLAAIVAAQGAHNQSRKSN
jgi:hypothetical protein